MGKRMAPGRWHSLCFTVDGADESMLVYLDGEQITPDPIDLDPFVEDEDENDKIKKRGRDRKGGDKLESLSLAGFAGFSEYGGYGGGYGGGFGRGQTPFGVPQEGFLLFASNSPKACPEVQSCAG